jgi:hypothetical protein
MFFYKIAGNARRNLATVGSLQWKPPRGFRIFFTCSLAPQWPGILSVVIHAKLFQHRIFNPPWESLGSRDSTDRKRRCGIPPVVKKPRLASHLPVFCPVLAVRT